MPNSASGKHHSAPSGRSGLIPVWLFLAWLVGAAVTPALSRPAYADESRSTIGGTVYLDEKRDGNPTGNKGIRGIEVRLLGAGRDANAQTNQNGTYIFENLATGTYEVRVVPPTGQEATTTSPLRVPVDGKNRNNVVDFGLAPGRPSTSSGQAGAPSPGPLTGPAQGAAASPKLTTTVTPTPSPTPAAAPSLLRQAQDSPPTPDPAIIQAALAARARAEAAAQASNSPLPVGEGGSAGGLDQDARLRIASLEPLRHAPGRDRLAQVRLWGSGDTLWLGVPFRTQIDGSPFAQVNCGPASLSMVLAAFGIDLDPMTLRDYVNFLAHNDDTETGTSLYHLARIAQEAGLITHDVPRRWTLEMVRTHVAQGHPVITLVRYQSLPGHGASLYNTDHYVVMTGLSGDDFIYNDAAFATNTGYGLLISADDLERAWSFSGYPGHSLAISLDGEANLPAWFTARQPRAHVATFIRDTWWADQAPAEEGGVQEPDDDFVAAIEADETMDLLALPEVNVLAESDLDLLTELALELAGAAPAGAELSVAVATVEVAATSEQSNLPLPGPIQAGLIVLLLGACGPRLAGRPWARMPLLSLKRQAPPEPSP